MLSGLLLALAPVTAFTILLAAMLLAGRILEATGRARPLPPGDLRERLESLSARAGVAVGGILVLPGSGGVNGRVLGLTRSTRRVVLTEGLLESLGPREVEAVFAHEVGHVRLGHPRWLLVLIAALLLLAFPAEALALALPAWVGIPLVLAAFLTAGRFLIGRVSRRFELEADLAAADLVGPEDCDAALARGEDGSPWLSIRHPSLASRRSHLKACSAEGPDRQAFEAAGRRIRRRLLVLLIASAGAFAAALGTAVGHSLN